MAIELNPEFEEAYYNRSNAKYQLKKYDEAILDYNKANKLNLELKNLNKIRVYCIQFFLIEKHT